MLCGGDPRGSLRRIEQAAGIPFRVAVTENRIAGNQQLGSRFDDAAHCVVSDTAVHFNPITETELASKFFEAANLAERVRDESLSAEAWIDAHDQHMVHHAEDRYEQVDLGVGIDDDGRLHLVLGDEFEGAVQVAARLVVDADPVRAGVGKGGDKLVGVLNHQVAIERQFRMFPERGDDGRADGDIGDEVAIHHIDVDHGAATALGRGDFVGQAGEVGGKDGWNELDHAWLQGTGSWKSGTEGKQAAWRSGCISGFALIARVRRSELRFRIPNGGMLP